MAPPDGAALTLSFHDYLAISRRQFDLAAHLLHAALFLPLFALRGVAVLSGHLCDLQRGAPRCAALAARLCRRAGGGSAPAAAARTHFCWLAALVRLSTSSAASTWACGEQQPLEAAAAQPLPFRRAARTLLASDWMLAFNELACCVLIALELRALASGVANAIAGRAAARAAAAKPRAPEAAAAAAGSSGARQAAPRQRLLKGAAQRLPLYVRWRAPLLLAYRAAYTLLSLLSAARAPLPTLPATTAFLVSSCCPLHACGVHLARDAAMLVGRGRMSA
jgi:hypothetical protein